MSLERKELLRYYRQFLRYGDRALGFTGQKSRLYRTALRQRFAAAAPTPVEAAAATSSSNSSSTTTVPRVDSIASDDFLAGRPTRAQLETTLTFIRNAAATAATQQPRGANNFEYRLLRELLHNEYSYALAASKTAATTTAATSTSSSLDPGTAAKPKKLRKPAPVDLASTRKIYRDLLDELNRTMGMCL
jgi:hypothetical protein